MTTTAGRPAPTCAVIGAGVAGLAAAVALARRGVAVEVFEAGDRVGGVIDTVRRDGFLAERGPNSIVLGGGEVPGFLRSLGLEARRLAPSRAARQRFIVRGGRPVAIPPSPLEMVRSNLLSTQAKLRLMSEPFVGRSTREDESIAAFVRRRLGPEALDYLAEPFVAGIFAGDPEQLSLRHALPMLHTLEVEHGSLTKGAVHLALAMERGQEVTTFVEGMAELPAAMARVLEGRVRLNARVRAMRRTTEGWRVEGAGSETTYDAVVVALPAHAVRRLQWLDLDASPLHALGSIRYLPVATLTLGFRREAVRHALAGYGMLVPRVEALPILGTVFSSSVFAGRAPEGHVTITTLVGGARDPGLAMAGEAAVTDAVLAALRPLLGIVGSPMFTDFCCWPEAIPQYELGYGRYLEPVRRLEAAAPGLAFAGSWRDGVAVGDTILSGLRAAERVASPAWSVMA